MLHILLQSPWQCDIAQRLSLLNAGDDLLLLQDGVLAALAQGEWSEKLLNSPATISVLKDDIAARGLSEQILTDFPLVDYNGFVELTIRHPQQLTW